MERENSFSQAMLADALKTNITYALKEDLGKIDLTSNLLKKNIKGQVKIRTKEKGILFGKAWVDECFKQIDKNIKITWLVEDGESISCLLYTSPSPRD